MAPSKVLKRSGSAPQPVADKPRARGRPARLSRQQILDAARRFKPQELTIPALAKALGVPPSSLYHHIDSRDDVLRELASDSARSLKFPPADPDHWRQWLHSAAHCLLLFCREHLGAGDGAQAAVSGLVFEPFLETMEEAGFETAQALLIANAVADWAFASASAEARLAAMGGREIYNRKARELIASLEPSLARRTIKAMDVSAKLSRKDFAASHLDWLIRGIPDP
ncbi:MAG TPA: TetR/AcrR family transcriptional regulator [Fontimonas sp.]